MPAVIHTISSGNKTLYLITLGLIKGLAIASLKVERLRNKSELVANFIDEEKYYSLCVKERCLKENALGFCPLLFSIVINDLYASLAIHFVICGRHHIFYQRT